ncbi:hypothetical protein ScPMuIL_010416 [Solemya velum]
MADSQKNIDIERQKLQDDIQRIRLALQGEDALEESDEESQSANLFIDTDYEDAENENGNFEDEPYEPPPPSGVREGDKVDLTDIQLGDVEHLPTSMQNCLALNRAYQEIITDMLRRVESALVTNREKQKILEDELDGQGVSKEKDIAKKKLVYMFATPYFKDVDGNYAPVNDDVKVKKAMREHKQDVSVASQWQSYERKSLLGAVRSDALERLLRDPMNKLELQHEKLLDSIEGSKERKDLKESISNLEEHIDELKRTSSEKLLLNVDPDKVDWLKISNLTFQGKRDNVSCKYMWQNVINPKINREQWSADEEQQLQDIVQKYDGKQWKVIANELGTNRTAFQCLQHYQQHLNSDTVNKSEWTPEEDSLLNEVVESCRTGSRISWNQVSYYMEGRSAHQCFTRWTKTDPALKRGKWTEEEDCMLMAAVHLLGTRDWARIKMLVRGRTAAQCRERYCNSLDPALTEKPTKWTYEEDRLLMELVQKHGTGNWAKISLQLQGRTDNNVLHRYRRLKEWQKRSEWLEQQNQETQVQLLGRSVDEFNNLIIERYDAKNKQRGNHSSRIVKQIKEKTGEELSPNNDEAWQLLEEKTGVELHDYVKQQHDKESGGIVVPRPPLGGYSSRSFLKMWERRLSLQKLIQAQIQKTLSEKTGMADIQEIASNAVYNLKDLRCLSTERWKMLIDKLRNKKPSEISVKEILEWTNKFVSGKMRTAFNAVDKLKGKKKPPSRAASHISAVKIDAQLCAVIQLKCSDLLFRRKRKGRPKRYCFFSVTDTSEEEDHEVALTTMGLLVKAMSVDLKVILQTASSKKAENPIKYSSDKDPEVKALEMFSIIAKKSSLQQAANVSKSEISRYISHHGKGMETSPLPQDTEIFSHPAEGAEMRVCYQGKGTEVSANVSHTERNSSELDVCHQEMRTEPRTLTGQTQKVLPAKKVMFLKKISQNASGSEEVSLKTISYTEIPSSTFCVNNAKLGEATTSQKAVSKSAELQEVSSSKAESNFLASINVSKRKPTMALRTIVHKAGGSVKTVELPPSYPNNASSTPVTKSTIPRINYPVAVRSIPANRVEPNSTLVLVKPTEEQLKKIKENQAKIQKSTLASSKKSSKQKKVKKVVKPKTKEKMIDKQLPVSENLPVSMVRNPVVKRIMLPMLPPNVTNLGAFKTLLLQRRLIIANAGTWYNPFLYKGTKRPRVTDPSFILKGDKEKDTSAAANGFHEKEQAPKVERNDTRQQVTPTVSTHTQSLQPSVSAGNSKLRDVLAGLRETPAYNLLRARFQAIFTWPALLSTVKNDDQAQSGDASKEKSGYKRKRYPCTGTKMFYKNSTKCRDLKIAIQERRLATREKNLGQLGSNGTVKEDNNGTERQLQEEADINLDGNTSFQEKLIGTSSSVDNPDGILSPESEEIPPTKKRKIGRPRGSSRKIIRESYTNRRSSLRLSSKNCEPIIGVTPEVTPTKASKRSNLAVEQIVASKVPKISNPEKSAASVEVDSEMLPQTSSVSEQLAWTCPTVGNSEHGSDSDLIPLLCTEIQQADGQQSMSIAMPLIGCNIEDSDNITVQSDQDEEGVYSKVGIKDN